MNKKYCSKCDEWKDIIEFAKDKGRKDGLQAKCKQCDKKYRIDKKEEIKKYKKNYYNKYKEYYKEYRENKKEEMGEYNKNYYQKNKEKEKTRVKWYNKNNKDKKREYSKKYWEDNKNKLRELGQKNKMSPILFNSNTKYRQEIKLYEEIKESPDGHLMCKCAYCGEWFEPTYSQIKQRVRAANGGARGECRLYCSQNCKDNCPIYNQTLYAKGQKPATSREVQPELRQMVFERDNYTCQKCDTHRDSLEVGIHCHHKEGILWEPLQSADIDMCVTLCEDCHKEVHRIPGCGYNDMKCV